MGIFTEPPSDYYHAYQSAMEEVRVQKALNAELLEALEAINSLDPAIDSSYGFNEWGESECFRKAQKIAGDILAKARQ